MINKTFLFISTMVLALSPFVTTNTWAESHEPKADEAQVECVSQKAYAEMSAEDKDKISAELCVGDEGEDTSQEPATKAEEGSMSKAEAPEVEESNVNCIPEETFRAMSAEDKEKRVSERCVGSE
jgi:hypothetical protein